jgi:hypothetical protein
MESLDAKVLSSKSGLGIGHSGVSISYSVIAFEEPSQ